MEQKGLQPSMRYGPQKSVSHHIPFAHFLLSGIIIAFPFLSFFRHIFGLLVRCAIANRVVTAIGLLVFGYGLMSFYPLRCVDYFTLKSLVSCHK
jgi:hypothetical protein